MNHKATKDTKVEKEEGYSRSCVHCSLIKGRLNQFAIRNSQFAIKFCDGDFDPNAKHATQGDEELNPSNWLNKALCIKDNFSNIFLIQHGGG
jgi:hypothetical protein